MANRLQLRKGNTAQNNTFVGAEGELSYDAEKNQVRIHDGATVGGKVFVDTSLKATTETAGLVKLNNTLTSSSTTEATTPAQVKILNDRFVNDFTNLKSSAGYQKLPSGLILQWGSALAQSWGATITFPIAFPSNVVSVQSTDRSVGTERNTIATDAWTRTSFVARGSNDDSFSWMAIGY